MVLWVGGLAFFAFVLAPLAFSRLPSPHLAGLVVGGTLIVLHRIGFVCGVLFVLATATLQLRSVSTYTLQMLLAIMMLAGTVYSQFHVLPAMERDRALAGGEVEAAPWSNPGRIDFEKQHRLSEKVEGLVFFCGVGIVLLLSREQPFGKRLGS